MDACVKRNQKVQTATALCRRLSWRLINVIIAAATRSLAELASATFENIRAYHVIRSGIPVNIYARFVVNRLSLYIYVFFTFSLAAIARSRTQGHAHQRIRVQKRVRTIRQGAALLGWTAFETPVAFPGSPWLAHSHTAYRGDGTFERDAML